jgi:hypothetical protein
MTGPVYLTPMSDRMSGKVLRTLANTAHFILKSENSATPAGVTSLLTICDFISRLRGEDSILGWLSFHMESDLTLPMLVKSQRNLGLIYPQQFINKVSSSTHKLSPKQFYFNVPTINVCKLINQPCQLPSTFATKCLSYIQCINNLFKTSLTDNFYSQI